MRTSEWIQAGFATLLALAAWVRPLPAHRRTAVLELAAFAVLLVFLARISTYVLTSTQASMLRDWLPVVLMLVPYWQTGRFFLGPDREIEARLTRIDCLLLRFLPPRPWRLGHFARVSMEWAYMLCYPMVPLGLATLYLLGLRASAGAFWFMVLVPTYLCYVITPFVPALPPRSNGPDTIASRDSADARRSNGRRMNLWILRWGSIQAISFPSAHVASALAVALVLLHAAPPAGLIFLVLAFWISIAAVVGGYHYAIDVVLGAALSLAVFAAWTGHLIPNTLFTAPAAAFAAPL